jgi:stearoyl-CoA desaturase (Delta-9 desaturase)
MSQNALVNEMNVLEVEMPVADERDVRAVEHVSIAQLSINDARINRGQVMHAAAILVLPTMGVAAAAYLAVRDGVSLMEVTVLAAMYSVAWIGITVGYHRLFTHHAFRAGKLVRMGLAIAGSTAGQGPVNYWVTNHRRHHHYSDKPGDIHSPYYRGRDAIKGGFFSKFFHSQVAWTFIHEHSNTAVIAKDMLRDLSIARIHRQYFLWLGLSFVLPAVVGGLWTMSPLGALKGFLWGGLMRLFLTYHSTNFITSLTHMWGKQVYKTTDSSRNNGWLAVITFGEAWHNNHHAFPSWAYFQHRWYQIDLGGIFIRTLELLGLVYDVRRPLQRAMDARSLARRPHVVSSN